jgi:hypothetical protein
VGDREDYPNDASAVGAHDGGGVSELTMAHGLLLDFALITVAMSALTWRESRWSRRADGRQREHAASGRRPARHAGESLLLLAARVGVTPYGESGLIDVATTRSPS